jgi:hypothetical protein
VQVDPDSQQVAPVQVCPPHWAQRAEHYRPNIESVHEVDGKEARRLTLPLGGVGEVVEEVVVPVPPPLLLPTVMLEDPLLKYPSVATIW